jgi:hypothetical protein
MNFEDARKSAQQIAKDCAPVAYAGSFDDLLEDRLLEAEHCWMFFLKRSVKRLFEPGAMFGSAYIVSKRGTTALIADYWDDEVKLQSYLQEYSDYLERRGE